TPVSPIQTTNGVFSFFDREGKTLGTVNANMIEGRAMRTELEGAPMPVFRFAGFGPLLGGTGFFDGADGMMSMNSVVSVFPRALSTTRCNSNSGGSKKKPAGFMLILSR